MIIQMKLFWQHFCMVLLLYILPFAFLIFLGLSLIFEVAEEMEKVARENTVVLVGLPALFMKVTACKCKNRGKSPGTGPL